MKKKINWAAMLGAGMGALWLAGCASSHCCKMNTTPPTSIPFGQADGKPVTLYTLRNAKGAEAKIMNYGGIVQSLTMPDRTGKFSDVVLGFDDLSGYTSAAYLKGCPYFGALIGRYGNRIGGAKFTLEGKTYTLAANNASNSLHGGLKGFDKVVWQVVKATGNSLALHYLSPDGEEGFPGNLNVTATYTLTDDNALRLEYKATTDKPTVVNLTQHSYFNLAGQGKGDILGHAVTIHADQTTPVDKELITTGAFASVAGTPFDFRKPTTIGAHINDADPVLRFGPGYDHNWVINHSHGKVVPQATVYEPTSGRVLEVLSDEPGLQFYVGNFLDGSIKGKGGVAYQIHTGFCMEPQHFPDSPNQPMFPTTELKPGQTYHNTIIYKFSVK